MSWLEVLGSHRFILQYIPDWNNRNAAPSHSRCHLTSMMYQVLLKPSLVISRKLTSSRAVGSYCLLVFFSSLHSLVSNSSYWLQHYVAALQLSVFVWWRFISHAPSVSTHIYVCMVVKVLVLRAYSMRYMFHAVYIYRDFVCLVQEEWWVIWVKSSVYSSWTITRFKTGIIFFLKLDFTTWSNNIVMGTTSVYVQYFKWFS